MAPVKPLALSGDPSKDGMTRAASPRRSLVVALLGFFTITLDALVVSVALPAIRDTLGVGIAGLQWVMDGYTLPFAALLLLAGTLSDRIGAGRAFEIGLLLFVASSALCAFAPALGVLIAARVTQGAGAAMMTPASLALIGPPTRKPAPSVIGPSAAPSRRPRGRWSAER